MKNIFKKLHKGSSSSSSISTNINSNNTSQEQHNRSKAETLTSSGTDQQTSVSFGQAPASPSSASPTIGVVASPTVAVPANNNRSDYFSSEEEFQVQLALAISASNSEFPDDAEKDQIRAATMMSLGRHRMMDPNRSTGEGSAEAMSRHYWDYNVIDYDEKVVDGFYDVYSLSMDQSVQRNIPSITDLESSSGSSGFEVVTVNRKIDPSLEELAQVAHCIAIDCGTADISLMVQRLAELVTEHMGGPVKDANVVLARWMERRTELQTSRHTSVFPVGTLQIGFSRHRALLFKVLADNIRLPCKLVKGSHYTGVEDDAVNMIKLENEREFLVDLMAEPGALIPADVLSSKNSSFKSYNPKVTKIPALHGDDTGVAYQWPKPLHNGLEGSSKNVADKKNLPLDKTSTSAESTTSMMAVKDNDVGTSGASNNGIPANQLDHLSSSAIGATLYKGGRGPNGVGDNTRKNINVIPYPKIGMEETKDLFADLNPFQIRGPSKYLVNNNPIESKALEIQRQRNNLVSGRPPLPFQKNRYALNEIPKKQEYNNVEGPFPKTSRDTNDYNFSSVASTSSATLERASPDATKSGSSYAVSRSNGDQNSSYSKGSALEESLSQFGGPYLNVSTSNNVLEKDSRDREALQSGIASMESEREMNEIGLQDRRKCTRDRFAEANSKLKDSERPTSSNDSRTSMADHMFDDVGECELPWEDLVLYERIGLGSYGEVYHADWNGTEVAVKKFLDQDFSGAALAEFKREVRIMRRLRHPNVVLFMGAVTRPPNLSIITEYLPRGSLYRIIHRPNCPLDEKCRIKMALDVAKGMNCLHTSTPTIVHRDLKSPNLLVDKNWNVKVCDFGLSRLKHNTFLSSKSTAGTPEWMAPEVLRNEPSNEKCDVYSFGVILWELATLKLPWSGMNPMQVVGAVGFQGRRLEIPKEVDPLVGGIIRECWQRDPSLRPSFAQLAVALKPLQQLQIPMHLDQPSSPLPQEISVNSTP